MFCPNCGTKCDEGAAFCGNCGTALLNETETVAPFADTAAQAASVQTEETAASVGEKAEDIATATVEEKAEDITTATVEEKAEDIATAPVEENGGEAAAPAEKRAEETVASPAEKNDADVLEGEKVGETVAPVHETAEDTASAVPPVDLSKPNNGASMFNGQPQPNQFNGQQPQFNNGAPMFNGQPQPNQFRGQQSQFNNGQQPQFNNGAPMFNGQPQPNQFNGQQPQFNNGQPVQQNVQKKAKKPFKIPVAAIVAAVAVVVIAIAAVVFTVVGKNATDYKKTVKSYVEAVAKGDYEKAFDYVNLPDSEFLTAEAFKIANGDAIVSDVASLNISDAYATVATVDVKKVNVNYVLSVGNAENLTLDLKKSDEKFMLFFNKYEIMGDNLVKKDVIVIVPKGMSLKVNGIAVDSKYVLSESEANNYYTSTRADVYKIPYIFVGTAKFTVSGDIIEEFEYEQEYDGDDYDPTKLNLLGQNYKYKESVISDLQKQAETDFNAMLKAALENKEISSTSVNISKTNKSNVEGDYESYFRGRLHRSSYYFDTMNVNNFKATASGTTYSVVTSTGTPRIKVSLSYTAAGSYIYETTGNKYIQSERNISSSYIYYVYEDGKWVINDMYIVLNTYSGTLQKNDGSNAATPNT